MRIAVCVLVNDNYHATKYCINNLLKKSTWMGIDLFIYNNGSTDERLHEFKEIAKVYHFDPTPVKIGIAYNKLFKYIINSEHNYEFISTFPCDTIVGYEWDTRLALSCVTIENCGIAAIKKGRENISLTPLLNSKTDKLEQVWLTKNEIVHGVCMFTRAMLDIIGGYDMQLKAVGFEQDDFCFRATSTGHRNFYITGQESVKTNHISAVNNPTKNGDLEVYKQSVNKLLETNIFKKPL